MADVEEIRPTAKGAKLGSSGVNVERLQNYLSRFGYLDSGVQAEFGMRPDGAEPMPEQHGQFDDATERALSEFQRRAGLEVTGEVDTATLDQLQMDRCGVPDVGEFGEFVLQGNKWSTTNLRYGFVEFTGDLSQAQIRAAISAAFAYWAAITPLTFTEVPIASNPEIRIRFVTGNHSDGSPFDGPNGVLAHAFYPPPNGGDIAGDTHFDDAETWTVNLPPSGIDLYTVAAHEFGHALGLKHSTVADALMYPFYGGPHRFLHADDIAGIQALYGVQQWHSSKQVLRVFTSYHAKNAWGYIQGVGWRKVKPATTDGVTNVLAALSEARGNGKTVTVLVTATEIEQLYL
jgi:hypothetical protein